MMKQWAAHEPDENPPRRMSRTTRDAEQQSEQQQATMKAFGDEACKKRKAGRSPIRILNESIKRKIHLQIWREIRICHIAEV